MSVERMTRAPWRRWRCDLRLASMVGRYRRRRPIAGAEARGWWQRRAMTRWLTACGWLRVR